jgi:dienelactone hydrolase
VPFRVLLFSLALIASPARAEEPAPLPPPPVPFPAERGSVPADPARRLRITEAPEPLRETLKRFDRLEPGFDWSLDPGRPNGWGYQIQHLVFPSPVTSPYDVNNTLHAEYYRPGGAGRRPAVIVLDILAGNAVVSTMVADTLARQGVAALMVRMAYYGERRPPETDRRKIESDPALLVDAMIQTAADVGRAAAWLRARPEVDPARVGLCGTSLGAFAAALAAGVYGGTFPRVLLIMGGGDVADVIWNGRETSKSRAKLEAAGWSQDRLARVLVPVDPLTWAARVPHGSVQMVNGTRDEVVAPANARKLQQALGDAAIQWYDAGHYTMAVYAPAILARAGRIFGEPAWVPFTVQGVDRAR